MMNTATKSEAKIGSNAIPNALVYIQCICFSILFGIWILPETILIRHICLILGALISLYVIYQNRYLLLTKQALPIWFLCFLFAWALFHLLFLGQDFDAQWQEWTTLWKRSAIGLIFAIGLGIAITQQVRISNGVLCRASQISWRIIFVGLALPTLIYWVKFGITLATNFYNLEIPDFLLLHRESAKYYVHKSSYVFFCLPLLAVSLGRLYQLCQVKNILNTASIIYVLCVCAVFMNFVLERDRNGEIYSFSLLLVFFGLCGKRFFQSTSKKNIVIGLAVLLIPLALTIQQLKSNEYWRNIFSDAKIAVEVEKYDHWKETASKGLPINDQGKMLTGSNYERIAWGYIALQLIADHPLGYGMVEKSFGYLGMQRYPDAKLHQSHSGWLDFALGMGMPGVALLLGSSILACLGARRNSPPWSAIGLWGLASIIMLFCTTEVSQKVFIDAFIFLIAFVSALGILNRNVKFKKSTL
jgi:hypothetical protein